uniref:BHLH domain-containing protein n=1 Tax=Heterorhabditis bacteriophora TaxID=37862 RepID=A0A1I7WGT7_HETBA
MFQEIQRIANILPINLLRTVSESIDFDGFHFPKETLIIPQISILMNDDSIFTDSNTFNPLRFLDSDGNLKRYEEFIPFSIGKRQYILNSGDSDDGTMDAADPSNPPRRSKTDPILVDRRKAATMRERRRLRKVEILRSAIEYINKLEGMLQAEGKMTKIMAHNQQMTLHSQGTSDYLSSSTAQFPSSFDGGFDDDDVTDSDEPDSPLPTVEGRKRTSLDRLSRIVANIAGEEGGVNGVEHANDHVEGGDTEKKLVLL